MWADTNHDESDPENIEPSSSTQFSFDTLSTEIIQLMGTECGDMVNIIRQLIAIMPDNSIIGIEDQTLADILVTLKDFHKSLLELRTIKFTDSSFLSTDDTHFINLIGRLDDWMINNHIRFSDFITKHALAVSYMELAIHLCLQYGKFELDDTLAVDSIILICQLLSNHIQQSPSPDLIPFRTQPFELIENTLRPDITIHRINMNTFQGTVPFINFSGYVKIRFSDQIKITILWGDEDNNLTTNPTKMVFDRTH